MSHNREWYFQVRGVFENVIVKAATFFVQDQEI